MLHAGSTTQNFPLAVQVNGKNAADEISFQADLSHQCFTVPVVDDNVVEYDEALTVKISSTAADAGSLTIFPSTVSVNIVDDDSKCSSLVNYSLSTNNTWVTNSLATSAIWQASSSKLLLLCGSVG